MYSNLNTATTSETTLLLTNHKTAASDKTTIEKLVNTLVTSKLMKDSTKSKKNTVVDIIPTCSIIAPHAANPKKK